MTLHSAVARLLVSSKKSIAFVCAIALLGVLARADQQPTGVGTWSPAGAVGALPEGAAPAVLNDGRMIIAGGNGSGTNGPRRIISVFDQATWTWSAAGFLSVNRTDAAAATLLDGRVVIAGGSTADGPTASIEIFDPATGLSAPAGALNTARSSAAAATLADGRVMIAGGSDGTTALDTVEFFNPATGISTPAANPMTAARVGATATRLLTGHILIAGGNDGQQDLASAELFHPELAIFTASASTLGTARSKHVALLLPQNNSVLIAGGRTNGVALASTELFLPAPATSGNEFVDGVFAVTGSMMDPRVGGVLMPLNNEGQALGAGGIGQSSGEMYRFATIKTDKDDYPPYSIVTITGSGWQPYEMVSLHLQESPAFDEHALLAVQADANGNIVSTEFSPDEHDLNVRFYLTAVGSASHAQNTFTDGVIPSAVALTSSANPSTFAQSVTLTATVTPTTPMPTGTVTFYDGPMPLGISTLNASGIATLATSQLVSGSHSIKAYYPGNVTYAASTSSVLSQSVTAGSQNGFASTVAFTGAGFGSQGVTVADFNGDGIADIAIAEASNSTVGIRLGVGNGTFGAETAISVVAGGITSGDFNGDGKVDLAIIASGGNFAVMLGNGNGTFGTPTNFAVNGAPFTINTADVNGDGKLDMVVGFVTGVGVYLGNGNGTFAAGTNYAQTNFPRGLVVADLNGDGFPDIATTVYSNGVISVMLNSGTGTFPTRVDYAVSGNPWNLVAADFNGDGKLDLAVTNSGSNSVSVLLNAGSGTFAAKVDYAVGINPIGLVAGDFNGDGKVDVVVANDATPGSLSVLYGNGNGTFAASAWISGVGAGPEYMAVGNFNGDSRLDLVVTNQISGAGNFSILLGGLPGTVTLTSSANPATFGSSVTLTATVPAAATGKVTFFDGMTPIGSATVSGGSATLTTRLLESGARSLRAYYAGNATYAGGTSATFTQTMSPVVQSGFVNASGSPITVGTSPQGIARADFNGDGFADLAITNASGNTTTILLGAGNGTFTAASGSPIATAGVSHVTAADLNADGKVDLVLVFSSGSKIAVMLGNGDGTFGAQTAYTTGLSPTQAAIGDFNGDGIPDVAVTLFNASQVAVFLGVGDGTLGTVVNYNVGTAPTGLAVADLNGDGKADIVTGNASTNNVSVLLGIGNGKFLTAVNTATNTGAQFVVVGDFNADGKLDVAATTGSNVVSVLLGNGDGTLQAKVDYATGGAPRSIAIGDLNGDGIADLAIANAGSATVSVLLGVGNGTFQAKIDTATGNGPYGVVVADFNLDGKADLAITNASNTVSILLGAAAASATQSTVSASPTAVQANNTATSTITVTTRDASGTPVANKTVTLAKTSGPGTPTIAPASAVSDVNGVATFTAKSATAGVDVFTATVVTDAVTITQTASVTFVGTPTAANSTAVASPTTVVADGSTTSTVTVTLKDTNGVVVSGKTVTLVKASGSGTPTITTVQGTTDASGVALFTVKSVTASAVVFTATDSTDSVTLTQQPTVTFVPGTPSVTLSTVSASPASVAANGSTTSTITVTLKDANSNLVSGKTVTLAQISGPGTATITTTLGTTNASGVATFTVKSTTAGADIFVATDTTDSVFIAQSATVTFTAGTPTAAQSTLTSSPASVPADGATLSTITATLKDVNGNAVSGKSVQLIRLSGPSPAIAPAGGVATTDASGNAVFTVKNTAFGVDTFQATDTTDSVTITQQTTVTFTAVVQTITFNPPANVAYGTATTTVSATASSGLAVTFSSNSSTVCTVSGATVTILKAGTCSITANQAGNAQYAAAAPVTQTFTVTTLAVTATLTANAKVYDGTNVEPNAAMSCAVTGMLAADSANVGCAATNGAFDSVSAGSPRMVTATVTLTGSAAANYTLGAAGTAVSSAPATTPATSTTASVVYGQAGSFTGVTANNGGVSANSLNSPRGVAADAAGNIYVADFNNSRVLYFPFGQTTATRVYGQSGSFTTLAANNGGVTANSLNQITRLALDTAGNLYIADNSNHRVLFYPNGSTTATRVYGQGGSFTSAVANNGGISANSLNDPHGVVVDSANNVYIADYGNNRILYYPSGSTTATRVYGQNGSFATNLANNTSGVAGVVSAASLNTPNGMRLDTAGNLYVADSTNDRVLMFPAGQTTATVVYGQNGDLTSHVTNSPGISANSLSNPPNLALDAGNNLYIADSANNRVLFYPSGSTTATVVYGQNGSFTTATVNNGGVSASSLRGPNSVDLDYAGDIYVSDAINNRVLRFNASAPAITPATLTVTGTSSTKPYGTTGAVIAPIYSGFVNGETSAVLTSAATCSSAGTAASAAPGTYPTICTGATGSNYSVSYVSGTLTVTSIPVTATLTASNKTYDGSTTEPNAGMTCTLAGVLAGDSGNVTCSATSGTFDGSNAGAHTVTATVTLGGSAAGGYTFGAAGTSTVSTTATASASITTATATASITASNKTYNGTTAVTGVVCSLSGLATVDSITNAVTCSVQSSAFGSAQVGSQTVTANVLLAGPSANNYTLASTTPTTTANITTAAVTATLTAAGKTYDRTTAEPAASMSCALAGVLAGDTANVSCTATSGTFNLATVGSRTVTATVTIGGTAGGNYTLGVAGTTTASASKTATASITAQALTATITASDKTYDGTTAATIQSSLVGVIAPDVVTVSGTGTFATKTAAAGKTVTSTNLAIAGADAGNYSLSSATATATAEITAKALTATMTADNKAYDGTTSATIHPVLAAGVIAPDAVTVSGSGTFDTKNAGTAKTVTSSNLALGGADASNYSLSSATATTTADVTAKSLTATITADNKTYDGTTSATIHPVLGAGVIAPDVVTVSGTGTFATKSAGTAKTVTSSNLAIGGADAGNYSLSSASATTTANIAKANATITVTGYTVTFDGSAHTATGSAAGVEAEDLTPLLHLGATTHTNAGDYPEDAWTFDGDTNYNSATGFASDSIAKASSATTVTCSNATYTGAALQTCAATATGAGSLSAPVTVTYTNNTNAGTASASATFAGDANHDGSTGSATFTIAKATSATTVTCSNATFTGAAQETCSATATGAGSLSAAVTVTYANNTNAGTASATATFAGDANHDGSTGSATFTIAKATSATAVTCSNATFTGAAQETCTATATGAGSLSTAVTVTYANNTNAGTASASATFAGDANHDGSTGSATFTIAKATSATTVTCGNATFTGAAQETCTATATGAGSLSTAVTVTYANNTNAGTASASATFAGDANHDASTGSATFTIAKATSATTVTCSNATYTGAAQETCSATATGAGSLSSSVTVSYTNNTNAGTASATATFAGDANHDGSTGSATFTIAKATSATAVTCSNATFTGAAQETCSATATGAGSLSTAVTVTYANNTNAGTASATATFAGDANHDGSTGSATFTIARATSATTVTCSNATFTGAAQETCTATATGAGSLSTAVTVTYANNVNAGTASASATFAGDANHDGSNGSATFTIAKASSAMTVTCSNATYTGAAQETCSATATGAGSLSDAVAVTYTNNTNAGTASASATFAGDANHDGSTGSATFTIAKATSATTVTCGNATFTGAAQETCTATATGAGSLSSPVTVTYANNTNAGTASASATFAGDANHDGSTGSATFTIAKASSATTVTCSDATFTGAAQETCTATATGAGSLSTAVTVTYANNTNAGTASASATFAGDANHDGSTGTATFTITKATSATTVTCSSAAYTGSAQETCTATATGAGSFSAPVTVTYTNNTNAGTASASATFAGDTNHDGSTGTATFVITTAASTTAVNCTPTVIYTGAPQQVCSVTVNGLGGLSLTPAPTYANNTSVGTASASYTFAGDANHDGSTGSATFTITKAALTVIANNKTRAALAPNPVFDGTLTGVLGTDGITATYSAAAATLPGTYPIVPTLVDPNSRLGNYTVASTNGTLTIVDTDPPAIFVPASVTAEATSASGATVNYTSQVSAIDAVFGPVSVNCAPASGTVFAIGTTQVNCTAVDGAGNTGGASFAIVVRDTTAPTLTTTDITVAATSAAGATVDYAPVGHDVVSGEVASVCSPTSGTLFSIGDHAVNCSATDAAGNVSSTSTFTVHVLDGVAPVVTVPATIISEATASGGATVAFSATASDNIDVTLTTTCAPLSGSRFPIGNTTVTCRATDSANNTGTASFTVTVRDTTAPTLALPVVAPIVSLTPTIVVNYTATATDIVDGSVAITCAPASGSAFPVGSTAVNCSATDAHGNTASGSFTVKVNDGVAPTVTVSPAGNRTVEATSSAGAVVTFTATASDNRDTGLVATCTPASGSIFPLGPGTLVTCKATDHDGNVGTTTFTVTVVDTTPPALTLPAPITQTTTSASGAAVAFTATALDTVSGAVPVTCAPASGTTFPAGTTTVRCTASDTRGNSASGTFTVTVNVQQNGIEKFVAFSRDSTRLRSQVTVVSGDVGANERKFHAHPAETDDGDRDDITVSIGEHASLSQTTSRVVGDTVSLMSKSSIYNLVDNFLINKTGSVLGTTTTPMSIPYLALPAVPTMTAGTTAVEVAKNQTVTLAAGSYGAVHVSNGGTLILTGGLYQVLSIDVDQQGTILFRGASTIRVLRELETGSKSKLILDQAVSGLRASQIVFYVLGTNANCSHTDKDDDGDDNGPAAVHIGQNNTVQANIYAANGTIWLKSKTQATGAFIGLHVRIGQNVTLTLDSAFR